MAVLAHLKRGQRGLTLIELMVTLAVLGIVIAVAVPSFSTMISNNRALALGEDLVGALSYARSEAVKRSGNVTLCASKNGAACDGAWTDNWIVIVDGATSEGAPAPIVSEVLRQWPVSDTSAAVSAINQGGANIGFVRFTGKGMLGFPVAGRATINVSSSGCTANSGRQLTLGVAGVLSVARSSTGCNKKG